MDKLSKIKLILMSKVAQYFKEMEITKTLSRATHIELETIAIQVLKISANKFPLLNKNKIQARTMGKYLRAL